MRELYRRFNCHHGQGRLTAGSVEKLNMAKTIHPAHMGLNHNYRNSDIFGIVTQIFHQLQRSVTLGLFCKSVYVTFIADG